MKKGLKMKKSLILIIVIFFFIANCILNVNAAEYTCGTNGVDDSCTVSGLQTLIDSANAGDIIHVATGTHTWTGDGIVAVTKPLTVSGGGSCTNCATSSPTGTWPTRIIKTNGNSIFRVGGWTGTGTARITGFHFDGETTSSPWGSQYLWNNVGAVYTYSTNDAGQGTERTNMFRVDNNYFEGYAMTAFFNQVYGRRMVEQQLGEVS
jgi:hypothetical protein